jgi:hypothetical protein
MGSLDRSQPHADGHDPLLRAVVQVAFQTLPLLGRGGDDPSPAGLRVLQRGIQLQLQPGDLDRHARLDQQSAGTAQVPRAVLAGDDHADIARSRSQGDRVRRVRRPGRGSVEVDEGGLRQVPGGDKSEVWAYGGVNLVIFAAGLGLVALGYYLASRRRTKAGALNLEGAHS